MACNKVYTQHGMQHCIYTTCHATQYIHNMACNIVYTQHGMQQSIYTTWHATKIIHNMACNKVYKFYNWKWAFQTKFVDVIKVFWNFTNESALLICIIETNIRVVLLQSIYKDEEYWLKVGHWGRKLKTKITFKVY